MNLWKCLSSLSRSWTTSIAPSPLEGRLQVFFFPKSKLHFFIYLVTVDPLILTPLISLPPHLIQRFPRWVPESEVNCRRDFIPVILHWSWFTAVTLRKFLLLILAVGYQVSYMEGFVNVTEFTIAPEVASVIVALVVNLCNWEWSQPFWHHLLLDIW